MSEYLSEAQLSGYVHGTLTDAEREAIDRHLAACPQDRVRLAQVEQASRQVRNHLAAEMNQIQAPASLTFAKLAGRVVAPDPASSRWGRGVALASAVLALVGVLVALGGIIGAGILENAFLSMKEVGQVQPITAHVRYPILACFLLAVPVAVNREYRYTVQPGRIVSAVFVFLLWLGSAVIALYEIYLLQGLVIYLAILLPAVKWLTPLIAFTPLVLGMVWIALVIGGGEIHYRNFGSRDSWKLFAWTLVIEMLILPLTLLI